MSYAIKREFIYGWDFTEFEEADSDVYSNHNGEETPIIYDTKEEADKSLADYIKEVNYAFEQGHMDSPYDDDCKVFKV
jgi:hypothetical protein